MLGTIYLFSTIHTFCLIFHMHLLYKVSINGHYLSLPFSFSGISLRFLYIIGEDVSSTSGNNSSQPGTCLVVELHVGKNYVVFVFYFHFDTLFSLDVGYNSSHVQNNSCCDAPRHSYALVSSWKQLTEWGLPTCVQELWNKEMWTWSMKTDIELKFFFIVFSK